MTSSYEERAKSLEGLPRAERFDALLEFPTEHLIKTIGRGESLRSELDRTLASLGFTGIDVSERKSSGGRYLSCSFRLDVHSGGQLDTVYTALEQLPGLTHLF